MSQKPFLPINLLHRHDGWSPEKQWAFVEALSRTASVTLAVRSVGMSAKSAYRLRQHPDAGEFRAAWDAALQQAWGQLEQVALDRVINGDRETIERNGYLVAERRKPCSEKLLIHLLGVRERAEVAARAERAAAHKVALAEARVAVINAEFARSKRRRRGVPLPEVPPLPVLPDDATAETASLQAFQDIADRFTHFPTFDECAEANSDSWDGGADGDAGNFAPDPNLAPSLAIPEHEGRAAARAAADAIAFANRPRWEDHVGGEKTRLA